MQSDCSEVWLGYFKSRAAIRPLFGPFPTVETPWDGVRLFVKSLRKFQLGESGDGRCLIRHAEKTGDAHYLGAIRLFIAEELDHAFWMGQILDSLQAPRLKRDWTNAVFIGLRRGLGLNQELLVLLVAEMIAVSYFSALHRGRTLAAYRGVFEQILRDEQGHVQFHCEILRERLEGLSVARKILIRSLWRILFRGACLVVWLDHGKLLQRLGCSPLNFFWNTGLTFDEVASAIFAPVPVRPHGQNLSETALKVSASTTH